MRYFNKLAEGIDVTQLRVALMRNPQLWNQDNCRREFEGTPHKETEDILLRFGSADGNDLEAVDTAAMSSMPKAKDAARAIMMSVGGVRLGRIVITRLEPGRKILPHSDVVGEYAKYYTRFHLVLQGLPGSLFNCGDETVVMQTGELWWFDASAEHSVVNNSKDDRLHMLVDVRIDP
jgi:hypothetical protein